MFVVCARGRRRFKGDHVGVTHAKNVVTSPQTSAQTARKKLISTLLLYNKTMLMSISAPQKLVSSKIIM